MVARVVVFADTDEPTLRLVFSDILFAASLRCIVNCFVKDESFWSVSKTLREALIIFCSTMVLEMLLIFSNLTWIPSVVGMALFSGKFI